MSTDPTDIPLPPVVWDDVDPSPLMERIDDEMRAVLSQIQTGSREVAVLMTENLLEMWESFIRRAILVDEPINFSGPGHERHLRAVHVTPTGDEVEFNRLMTEKANAGTLDGFGQSYNLPVGPVLVYKGLAATRREVTESVPMTPALPPAPPEAPPTPDPQTTLIDVTDTGTLSLADIEHEVAKTQARRNAKPRPPRKRS